MPFPYREDAFRLLHQQRSVGLHAGGPPRHRTPENAVAQPVPRLEGGAFTL
jgi:hypothetical protein